MVQLTVRLVPAPDRVDDIVRTLRRVVMLPAQQLPGCHFAQVYQRVNEPLRVDYVEEWDDFAGLRPELSGERFGRLLEKHRTCLKCRIELLKGSLKSSPCLVKLPR